MFILIFIMFTFILFLSDYYLLFSLNSNLFNFKKNEKKLTKNILFIKIKYIPLKKIIIII